MPLYTFRCPEHGTFDEYRSISTRNSNAACPRCERVSSRDHEAELVHVHSTRPFPSNDPDLRRALLDATPVYRDPPDIATMSEFSAYLKQQGVDTMPAKEWRERNDIGPRNHGFGRIKPRHRRPVQLLKGA